VKEERPTITKGLFELTKATAFVKSFVKNDLGIDITNEFIARLKQGTRKHSVEKRGSIFGSGDFGTMSDSEAFRDFRSFRIHHQTG